MDALTFFLSLWIFGYGFYEFRWTGLLLKGFGVLCFLIAAYIGSYFSEIAFEAKMNFPVTTIYNLYKWEFFTTSSKFEHSLIVRLPCLIIYWLFQALTLFIGWGGLLSNGLIRENIAK
jgi:hypothetical protein